MDWTEEKQPNTDISYNHVILTTPIGDYIVDWKGWKETPTYDVNLNGEWLGCENNLQDAKIIAENHLYETANQLAKYIGS